MTRKEALAAGAMFYTGKVCAKHVELEGQRRLAQGNCPGCIRDRMKRNKKKNRKAVLKRQREWARAVRAGTHVPRKYRKAGEVVT
jgi:hypothetical protein